MLLIPMDDKLSRKSNPTFAIMPLVHRPPRMRLIMPEPTLTETAGLVAILSCPMEVRAL